MPTIQPPKNPPAVRMDALISAISALGTRARTAELATLTVAGAAEIAREHGIEWNDIHATLAYELPFVLGVGRLA